MLLTKAAQVYLTVGCELGTITHNLLWQMFSSSSHPDTLSTAAAWAGNRVLVAFEQEIVFWPDNSDNANKRTQGSHSLPHYIIKWCTDLSSYRQRAAPHCWGTVSAEAVLCPTGQWSSVSPGSWEQEPGHDEAELITSQVDTSPRHPLHGTLLETVAVASTRRITWANNVRTRYY